MKPASIKKFDWLYLGSVAVGLAGVALNYGNLVEAADAELAAQGVESMGGGLMAASLLFVSGFSLALWFLISVLRIEVVKWLIAAITAWSLYSYLGNFEPELDQLVVLQIVSTVMTVAALYFLFQPDAKAWFDEKRDS
ncbi:MAG: hypothetical protein R3E14_06650 [Erythrobacter sp.]